jgi:regulator of protease activity HflC (stomatin/prohibitin superfamily)
MFGISIWWIPVWAIVAYVVLSIHVFSPTERAASYKIGKRWRAVGPGGWGVFPLLFTSVKRVSTTNNRVIFPGKKSQIVRDDDVPLQWGQVRPMRIIHASRESALFYVHVDRDDPSSAWRLIPFSQLSPEEKELTEGDALQSSITTEDIAYVDWNLKAKSNNPDPTKDPIFDFVENITSVGNANERITSTCKGALQDLLGPITARHSISVKGHLQDLVKERVEILVGEKEDPNNPGPAESPWGINITAVQIEEVELGKRVNAARSDEASAIAKGNETRTLANAAAYEEETRGAGKAAAFERMAKILETEGGHRAAKLEAAKEVLAKSGTIIMQSDPGDIISSLTATSKVIENQKKK